MNERLPSISRTPSSITYEEKDQRRRFLINYKQIMCKHASTGVPVKHKYLKLILLVSKFVQFVCKVLYCMEQIFFKGEIFKN